MSFRLRLTTPNRLAAAALLALAPLTIAFAAAPTATARPAPPTRHPTRRTGRSSERPAGNAAVRG